MTSKKVTPKWIGDTLAENSNYDEWLTALGNNNYGHCYMVAETESQPLKLCDDIYSPDGQKLYANFIHQSNITLAEVINCVSDNAYDYYFTSTSEARAEIARREGECATSKDVTDDVHM